MQIPSLKLLILSKMMLTEQGTLHILEPSTLSSTVKDHDRHLVLLPGGQKTALGRVLGEEFEVAEQRHRVRRYFISIILEQNKDWFYNVDLSLLGSCILVDIKMVKKCEIRNFS